MSNIFYVNPILILIFVDFFNEIIYNILMKLYEHVDKFEIKYCDVDFKDELKPSVALSFMEEGAGASADELGFGYAYLKSKGYAFMVSNNCFEFLRPIILGEEIFVKTWPLPPSHVIFGREYRFVDEKGEVILNASSRWCLIDMKTGKILSSKVIENQDYSTYNTTKVFENVKWKIPTFSQQEGILKFFITIANSEYDHNMHVNNTKYADYCFNCFSIAELAQKKLKRFSISYIKQCKEGDTIRFYRKQTDESGVYLVQGFNDKDEMVVQAQIIFQE